MTQAADPILITELQHLVLTDVSWQLYDKLLEEVGERPIRITYHQGSIEIMSPLPKHDKWKSRIGRMIEIVALEQNVPMETLGSTTFRHEQKDSGLEPDECYYIQHAADIRGKDRLDLSVDPPPDLAVEIDITRRSIARQPIYAALRVPELWRFDGQRLQILHLTREARYEERDVSLAFPFLPMSEIRRFLDMLHDTDDTTVMRAFQQWLRTLPH
jgi:Uma2 family endonuclease